MLLLLCNASRHASGAHPRLLLSSDDLPAIRHACGVGNSAPLERGFGRFAARRADYLAVRMQLSGAGGGTYLVGELAGAAFVELVEPGTAGMRAFVDASLTAAPTAIADAFEHILALDWTWDRLEPHVRQELILALRRLARPLSASDSPLEHRAFREKLASLALAVAVDEQDDPSAAWAALRAELRSAARTYFEQTFPTFLEIRGLAPTSPSAGPFEESDAFLAVELARHVLAPAEAQFLAQRLERWLEHYLLMGPEGVRPFPRDDGLDLPLTPADPLSALAPLTAHGLAARTGSPAARALAERVGRALRAAPEDPRATAWRWAPCLYPLAETPLRAAGAPPTARNLGSAVVLTARDPAERTIWIETGTHALRSGQHADAGHFLIRGRALLLGSAGDPLATQAIAALGGAQGLGQRGTPFSFDEFASATIAHNGLIAYQPGTIWRWRGRPYAPCGGQRPVESSLSSFAPDALAERRACRTLAYGQRGADAYLALELSGSYDPRAIRAYSREFVLAGGRLLLIVDRVQLAEARATPTLVFNLPARPSVFGADLRTHPRVAGSDQEAGVWALPAPAWITWDLGDESIGLLTLAPAQRAIRAVGGPARAQTITAGAQRGGRYVGGQPDGFERLIVPSQWHDALNAWYRLGTPTVLPPTGGSTNHWGRIEVSATQRGAAEVFISLIVLDRSLRNAAPQASVAAVGNDLEVRVQFSGFAAAIRLAAADVGGAVLTPHGNAIEWPFPTDVAADSAWPVFEAIP